MKAGLLIPRFSCPIPLKFCRNPNTLCLGLETLAIASTRRTILPTARAVPLNRADVISELLPFIQRFHGNTIVVSYGDAAMKTPELRQSVIKDLVFFSCVGLKMVLVHGGGPEINAWLTRIRGGPTFCDGLRVTDEKMEVIEMVLMEHVCQVVSLIDLAGATALGFCARDTNFLTARPAPEGAALGYVGELSSVNPEILHQILANSNMIPVIAPIAADQSGQTYIINADTAAAEIAAAIGAKKLILLTDAAGILEDKNDPYSLIIKEIDVSGIKKMIAEGKLDGGILPKVECCIKSLTQGVQTTSITDGRIPHSLLLEIVTDERLGTMIRN